MITHSQLYDINSGRRFSGDGTWTEAHVICSVVSGQNEDEALAKAAAAFGHRDGRPDPLFSHAKSDTFDLGVELESLPLAVSETPWKKYDMVSQLGTDKAKAALEQARNDSNFGNDESIIFNEWGDKLTSEDELQSTIAALGDTGWLIVGIGLKPTGAGEGNEDYIGNVYEIYCQNCGGPRDAECVNIVFDDRHGGHDGVWTCQDCGANFRGVHPQGPAGQQKHLTDEW